MKTKVLIFVFAFFCVSTVFSQNWFAGGNVSVRYNDFDGVAIELSPEIGYRINKKFDLGLSSLFRYNNEIAAFGVEVFTRYSFFEINKFSMLGRIGLHYINVDFEGNALGVYLGPVFQYKLLDKFSLYASVGSISYLHMFGIGNNFNFNFSTNISLGCYILFGSSKKDKIESSEKIESGEEE